MKFLVSLFLVFTISYHFLMACPMCKEAVKGAGKDPSALARGFQWSILAMLTVPYILIGAIALLLYFSYRKQKQKMAVNQPTV